MFSDHARHRIIPVTALLIVLATGVTAAPETYPNREAALQTAQGLSLAQFLARCDADMVFCRSVVDILRDAPPGESGACLELTASTSEVTSKSLDLLKGALKDHPDWASDKAIPNLYSAMSVIWPCKD